MDRDGFADFLRRRRSALQPDDVGLPRGARRRTGGLRREEVAALAHMSVDFYTRLEQSRGSYPSQQTAEALATALRLSDDERAHLLALAGYTPPPRAVRATEPSAELLRVLEQLVSPAQIVSDLGVVLYQNDLAKALLGEFPINGGLWSSIDYGWFTDPSIRTIFPPEEHLRHSREHVAGLRALHARLSDDPEVRALVDRLLSESVEFRALWESHEVRRHCSTQKRFVNAYVGELSLDCQILTAENERERLMVFSAIAGSEDARKLERLAESARRRRLKPA